MVGVCPRTGSVTGRMTAGTGRMRGTALSRPPAIRKTSDVLTAAVFQWCGSVTVRVNINSGDEKIP